MKQEYIMVRISSKEKEEIKKTAMEQDMTVSDYLRKLAYADRIRKER